MIDHNSSEKKMTVAHTDIYPKSRIEASVLSMSKYILIHNLEYQSNFSYFFFFLSFILGKQKMAINKRKNSYTLCLLSFSVIHRDHFLSFICIPIVQQYLSLSNKRHRSSPTFIILLFNSYRAIFITIKVFVFSPVFILIGKWKEKCNIKFSFSLVQLNTLVDIQPYVVD